VGDKFERTPLDGYSDTHAGVLSSGIHLWDGNESKRTLLGVSHLSCHTLSSSFLRHPFLGGKRIQKNWVVVQSHPPVPAECTGKWAQVVPVPHAQAVAGQPLDNALPPAWSIPGHGLGWIVALTKERAVLCQIWLDSKFLESL